MFNFIMQDTVYIDLNSPYYNNIYENSDIKILFALFKTCFPYSCNFVYGNEIVICQKTINNIKELTGRHESTIRNSICSLAKSSLLLKHPKYKAIYYLNPNCFFKGNLEERASCVEACIKDELINE